MLRGRPVLLFFLLACAFSWPGFFVYGLGRAGLLPFRPPAELPLLAEYGPTFAAIVMSLREGGWPVVKQLLARGLRWRVGWQWYAVALLLSPAMMLATVGILWLFGHAPPDFRLLAGWGPRFVDHMNNLGPSVGPLAGLLRFMDHGPVAVVIGAIVVAIMSGGVTEEFGWRGYAQPRLSERWNALRASVVVGILWGLWHLGPWQLFFTLPVAEAAAANAMHVLDYLLGCIPVAVLFGWVYYNTRGSVLLAILFHAAHNTAISTAFNAWPDFPYHWWQATMWLTAAAVTLWYGPARLARTPPPGPARSGE